MTRLYLMSSMQHGTGNGNAKGNCQQFQNPLDSAPVQRALFVALEIGSSAACAAAGRACRASPTARWCRRCRRSGMGFPNIPGVTYNGLMTTRYLFNYGPRFDQGIMDLNPPTVVPPYQDNPLNGPIYHNLIPKTDADGNDIAGVRLPDVRVPLNTYTGWALRAAGLGENDGCEGSGQRIPFPATKAAREASRRSAAVGRGALCELPRLLLQGHPGGERLRRRRLHARRRRPRDGEPHAERGLRDRCHQAPGRRRVRDFP